MTLIYDRSAELRGPPKTVAALSRGQKESAGGADNFAWTAPAQRCHKSVEKPWKGRHTCRAGVFFILLTYLEPANFYPVVESNRIESNLLPQASSNRTCSDIRDRAWQRALPSQELHRTRGWQALEGLKAAKACDCPRGKETAAVDVSPVAVFVRGRARGSIGLAALLIA